MVPDRIVRVRMENGLIGKAAQLIQYYPFAFLQLNEYDTNLITVISIFKMCALLTKNKTKLSISNQATTMGDDLASVLGSCNA